MQCTKCGKEIAVGEVTNKKLCESCLGIINPYDNPDKYKYYWCGNLVTLDQLPPFARKFFPTLDMYKGE